MTRKQGLTSARQTILSTLPEETSLFGRSPEPRFTHIPASHAKALHPDVQVVMGMRGAGKSFWWAALQNQALRTLVADRVPLLRLFEHVEVHLGFGEIPKPKKYPGRDTLEKLLQEGHKPRMIWRTVVLGALDQEGQILSTASDWSTKVRYVEENPDTFEQLLYDRDTRLDQDNRYAIVLFDALDRSASDWQTMNGLIRGLLETALDLRPYRRVRVKCFLRTDQIDERNVSDFPDASKVLTSRIELSWPYPELYAMLFQYLGNAEDDVFRSEVTKKFGLEWSKVGGVCIPPQPLAREEKSQREVFHDITGPWMGRDHRRGFPYTWVPGHLADAHGRTSPRSFLAALRQAAVDSEERYVDHGWPLHYESIKRGVQAASEIRRNELREDYPWVDALMEPLKGMVVPCSFEEIASVWDSRDVLERLQGPEVRGSERLPPAHLVDGPAGLRQDLEELAIFLRMKDGRVNVPDVFRVAYGLGRRGGVKPLRKGE